jgi:hypothetical protein
MLNKSPLARHCRAFQTIARLTIPSRKIDLIVVNGAYGRTLVFGPGYAESARSPVRSARRSSPAIAIHTVVS